MMDAAELEFGATATGYGSKEVTQNDLKILDPKVEYALFPVWLLTCRYEGKDYQYAINGQTGKLTGEFPVSDKKGGGIFASSFLAFLPIFYLILLFIQIFF